MRRCMIDYCRYMYNDLSLGVGLPRETPRLGLTAQSRPVRFYFHFPPKRMRQCRKRLNCNEMLSFQTSC